MQGHDTQPASKLCMSHPRKGVSVENEAGFHPRLWSPRVSVIIPAYNAAATLRRAATSVLSQTESNLELLLVDDASTDGTFQAICEIVAEDARVCAVRFQRNRGKSAAINA